MYIVAMPPGLNAPASLVHKAAGAASPVAAVQRAIRAKVGDAARRSQPGAAARPLPVR